MSQWPHKTWEVVIASLDDERFRDRIYDHRGHHVWIPALPIRAEYIIDSKLRKVAERKALQLAVDEGITRPFLKRSRCLSHRFQPQNFGGMLELVPGASK